MQIHSILLLIAAVLGVRLFWPNATSVKPALAAAHVEASKPLAPAMGAAAMADRSCVAQGGKWYCFSKRPDAGLPSDKGRLHMDYYENGKWQPGLRNVAGVLSSPPECFVNTDISTYPIICFATGADGWLYAVQANTSGWSAWTRIQSGELASRPNCFQWVDGKSIACMPRTKELTLAFLWWDGAYIGPRIQNLGGWLVDAPVCKSFSNATTGPFGCMMTMHDHSTWMVLWENDRWTWLMLPS
ncbi:MAG: hypothetical protein KIH69_014930 [Anaerolineae bacterium]|nr:hypothetical protein [Anaerolineae bacterium]